MNAEENTIQREKDNYMYSKKEQVQKVKIVTLKAQMPLPELKRKAQRIFNAWIRNRDRRDPCISCGKHRESNEAGHYIPMGSCGLLRYCEDNVHKQCFSCNHFKHANLTLYRINLCKKIGKKRVEFLEEHMHDTKQWSREEVLQIIEKYKLSKEE